MLPADLLREAAHSIAERPGRAFLASLGSILGVATVLAIIGVSFTASNQISVRFDALLSTRVIVEPASTEEFGVISEVDVEKVKQIGGVRDSARIVVLDEADASLRAVGGRSISVTPVLVSQDFVTAAEVKVDAGVLWDPRVAASSVPPVLLGRSVVLELDLPEFDGPFTLWMNGKATSVIGYAGANSTEPRVDGWVLMPEEIRNPDVWEEPREASLLVRVSPGAGPAVADIVPFVIDAEHPDRYLALAPPAPEVLRANVEGDTRIAFLAAGGIALLVGAVAISSATLTSIVERTEQFGIRRALGATKQDIRRLVMLETTFLGALGGFLGGFFGLTLVLGISLYLSWQPVLDWRLIPLAIALGVVVGLGAGLVPAHRASRIEPIAAIRRV